jgi:hypothetical protein
MGYKWEVKLIYLQMFSLSLSLCLMRLHYMIFILTLSQKLSPFLYWEACVFDM